MKNISLFIFLFLISFTASAQKRDSVTVVEPQNFPVETNLPGDVAFYTRESNANRKVLLSDILTAAGAKDGGTVSFTPTATGNAMQYRNKFVQTPTGDVYFIDVLGNSVQFVSGDVDDADSDPQNEIQNLMLVDGTLVLSGGGGNVDISVVNTDEQTLNLNGNDELSISNGNTVNLSGYAVDNQILTFDNSTGQLTITGTGGGSTVTIPAGNGGDNWGNQAAETDATIGGDGTSANPLTVEISADTDNIIETRSDGIYATAPQGGGASEITYTSGDARITATGTGVTYSQSGNTATIEIPQGVRLKYVAINEIKDFSANDYVVKIIDRNGTANSGIDDFMPVLWDFVKRDNLETEPPTPSLAFEYTDDNPPTSKKKITGYGTQTGGGTFLDTTFIGVDSYGSFTVAGYIPF